MKKLAVALCLTALTTGAFAQGLVNFFNNSTTLISSGLPGNSTAISGAVGSYYFALLTAPSGTTDPKAFTFSGAYGTNQTVAGRFTGGGNVVIQNWAPGTIKAFEVAGWSSSLGTTFNSAWLTSMPGGFGLSTIASGSPGGFNAGTGGTDPNLVIFSSTSIASGFLVPIPEPGTFALAGLGAAAMLIFRRRK